MMVMKLFFMGLGLMLWLAIGRAETIHCPAVEMIQAGQWGDWLPLYREGEELAFDSDVLQFQQQIMGFKLARWSTTYLESAHCFYYGSGPVLDRIVFAHDAWQPIKNPVWDWLVLNRLAVCQSEWVSDCLFIL